jgi:hypothetical protein
MTKSATRQQQDNKALHLTLRSFARASLRCYGQVNLVVSPLARQLAAHLYTLHE